MNLAIGLFKSRALKIDYKPGSFVREFDGWRGVGIVFVVLAHYFPSLFIGSWVFMEMFFVMSGFLITGILMDSKYKKNYYTRFMKRRIMRVFPLYYLCLFILFFLLPGSWLDLSYYRSHQLWFWLYVENWLFAIDGWPQVKALHHFWSLAIEEQFYILWPLVVWIFRPRRLLRFCLFLFLFSLVFRNIGMHLGFVMPFPYVATFGRMEGIVLGAIIAIMVRSEEWKVLLEKWTYPVTVVSGILVFVVFVLAGSMKFQDPFHYSVNYTLVDIFFAGMITMTLCNDELRGLKKILNLPLFSQLGIMSYCIYIFHYPIQGIIENNYLIYFQHVTGSAPTAKILCILVSFLITVPVVYLVHKKIEVPLWRVKKRI